MPCRRNPSISIRIHPSTYYLLDWMNLTFFANCAVIVVGGGLAGLSACHTVLERGGNVLLLDKNAFLGGNSTKATSGINGAGTSTQIKLGIPDNSQIVSTLDVRSFNHAFSFTTTRQSLRVRKLSLR